MEGRIRGRWWWAWVCGCVVVGVVLRWRVTGVPLFADDFLQRAMLRGEYPVERAWWDLFAFVRNTPAEHAALVGRGFLPWWTDPELQIAMFRPLSSALIAFDAWLFRGDAFIEHLHSLAWWCALVVVAARLYARWFSPRVAFVATALIALDDAASTPLAWVANRNALVAGVFGALGLTAFIDALDVKCERPRRTWAFVLGAFSLAALSGEYALGWVAAVIVVGVSSGGQSVVWRGRAVAIAFVPFVVTLCVARGLGYGARGTGSYVDPFTDTARWCGVFAERMGALVLDLVFTLPAELISRTQWTASAWRVVTLALGFAVLLHFSLFRPRCVDGQRARGFALASLLGCVPSVGVEASSRLLVIPALLWAPAIAWLITLPFARSCHGVRALATAAVSLSLVFTHGVLSSIVTYRNILWFRDTARLAERLRRHSPLPSCRVRRTTQVVVSVGEIVTLNYLPFARADLGCVLPVAWRALTATRSEVWLRRTDPHTVEMGAIDGPLFMPTSLSFLRDSRHPLRAGARVTLDGFEATVLAAQNGMPSRLRFRFDRELSDGDVRLGVLGHGGLERVSWPKEGEVRRFGSPELFGP